MVPIRAGARVRRAPPARAPIDAGVYRITNTATGTSWVASTSDLKAFRNRFEFSRSTNSPNGFDARARAEAERYATKLTADAEDYAERTLDELASVLHRSAQTAEQGRAALAQRRAGAWA